MKDKISSWGKGMTPGNWPATGHIATTVRNQREINANAQLTFYSFSEPSPQSGAPVPISHIQEESSPHGHTQLTIS